MNWLGALFRTLRRARVDGSLLPSVEVRAAAAVMMSLVVGASSMTRTHSELAFGDGPFGKRDSAQQWLGRMLRVVRPALSGR